MPLSKPTSQRDLTAAQLERGLLSEFPYYDNVRANKWEGLKVVTDGNSLLDSKNPYDKVSPKSWLMFASWHPPASSARNNIFHHSYDKPVAPPNLRLGTYSSPSTTGGGFRYTIRNSNNRITPFYTSYCPGVGNGAGITATAKTPKGWPANRGKIFTLTNNWENIYISDNERCVKQGIRNPKGYGYSSIYIEDIYSPGYLGEGNHTVQLGVYTGKDILWTPQKRDFFGLPVYQYIDLSARDKEIVSEFKLPTSFNGINGTWHVRSFANDAIQYGPLHGGVRNTLGVAKTIKDGNGNWKLGYGYAEGNYTSNTIEDLVYFKWNNPSWVTVDQMIKSFHIGIDGTICIKKYSDYARLITAFRKNTQHLSNNNWFNIKLYWVPKDNNPVNTVNTIAHCVTLWVKF